MSAKGDPGGSCVLCRALGSAGEEDSLLVHAAALSFVVMNLYPYNSGHVMVAPRRHVGNLAGATPDELAEMMDLARRLETVMGEVYRPDGLNLGMNLGRAAGAGVPDHLHLHVVPRWNGDTNYMTVAGQTRVIPEDPVEAAARLRAAFAG
ncbi:MAG TPA: HIT domain-containing protein [Vicinamibacteria bacterium]|nr:HIT domain-containing protein [Vicinamibacteria bacterium]